MCVYERERERSERAKERERDIERERRKREVRTNHALGKVINSHVPPANEG